MRWISCSRRHLNVLAHLMVFGTIAVLSGCSWYPPSMDGEVQRLKSEVEQNRTQLSQYAAPYRAGPGRGFQLDASFEPLNATFAKYNDSDRLITLSSFGSSGVIAQYSTGCSPFPDTIAYIEPLPIPGAFGAVIYVDKLEPSTSGASGFRFHMRNSAAAGYLGAQEIAQVCGLPVFWSPAIATVVSYTLYANGSVSLAPIADVGLEYTIKVDKGTPLYFFATVTGGLVNFAGLAPYAPQLFKGTLNNVIGKVGVVRIANTDIERHYKPEIDFNGANYINLGVTVYGPVVIHWDP